MSASVFDGFWQLPPLARTAAGAAFTLSVLAWTDLIPIRLLIFHPFYLWKFPPEIWRIPTSFLLTGPKVSIFFDTYFLYQYLSQLEMGHPKFPRREDLLWYLIFVGGVTMTLDQLVLGGSYMYLQALIVAMCYTVTQDMRGMKSTFFFFTIPAQLTPYCMIAANILIPEGAGRIPLQICGLLVAHLHDFLTRIYPEFGGGRNWIPTPSILSRFTTTPRILERSYGTMFRGAPAAPTSGSSTGASTGSGPLPDSWRTRGAGHRLGGD